MSFLGLVDLSVAPATVLLIAEGCHTFFALRIWLYCALQSTWCASYIGLLLLWDITGMSTRWRVFPQSAVKVRCFWAVVDSNAPEWLFVLVTDWIFCSFLESNSVISQVRSLVFPQIYIRFYDPILDSDSSETRGTSAQRRFPPIFSPTHCWAPHLVHEGPSSSFIMILEDPKYQRGKREIGKFHSTNASVFTMLEL